MRQRFSLKTWGRTHRAAIAALAGVFLGYSCHWLPAHYQGACQLLAQAYRAIVR